MHLDWNGESQHFLYNRIVNCVPLEIGFQCNIVCIEKIKNIIIINKKIKKISEQNVHQWGTDKKNMVYDNML